MIDKTVLRAWGLLALAFGGAGGAWAQNFDFSYQVSGLNVMGTFVTTSNNDGTYLITDILNGFRGSNAITLLAPGQALRGYNDNLLIFPADPGYFTGSGFGYASGGTQYAAFFNSDGDIYFEANSSNNDNVDLSNVTVAQAAPAPHPGGGGLSFLALGLFGLGYSRRRIVGRVRQVSRSGAPRAMIGKTVVKTVVRAWVLLALAFGGAGGARAQNFDFSYTASGVSVAGTFVTTSNNDGTYLITSIINGMRGGSTITLLAPGTSFGSFTNDNILIYPGTPNYFTVNGFGFTTGSANYNTYYQGQLNRYNEFNASGGQTLTASNVQVAPAPHPGGGLLSFLALGLVGLFHSRRAIVGRVRGLFTGCTPPRSAPVPAVRASAPRCGALP